MGKLLKILRIALLFFILAGLANQALHGQFLSKTGSNAAAFLKIPVGARATGLGGAVVATVDGPSALYWNPAAITGVKEISISAEYSDWLLDLDADESISPALAEEIAELFQNGEPPYRIYRTPLALVPPVGKPWREFGLQTRHKLYDRRVVRAPAHEAWDQFEIPEGAAVGRLREPIMHHAFAGAEQFIAKVNRNSSARAEALPLKSKPYLALRIVFGLPAYFSKKYFLQQYFRGGVYGFALALMSGYGRWLRDVKMWERLYAQVNPDNNL